MTSNARWAVEGLARPEGTRRRSAAGGLLPLVAALALWVGVLAGVLAPLGEALGRLDGRGPPTAACPVPPGAIASAARPPAPAGRR